MSKQYAYIEHAPFRCALSLFAWWVIIVIVGGLTAPRLNRISYPQLLDLLFFVLAPMGAYNSARWRAPLLLFFLYGCASSVWFALLFPEPRGPASNLSNWQILLTTFCVCTVTVGLGFVCRAAAVLRWQREPIDPWPKCDDCGYNLTGNKSGVCPECGFCWRDNATSDD